MSWTCHHCETQNEANSTNCEVCGYTFQKEPDWVCAYCKSSNSITLKNCAECGKIREWIQEKIPTLTLQENKSFDLTADWKIPGETKVRKVVDPNRRKKIRADRKNFFLSRLPTILGALSIGIGLGAPFPILVIIGTGLSFWGILSTNIFIIEPSKIYLLDIPEEFILVETTETQNGLEFEESISQIDLSNDNKVLFVKTTHPSIGVLDPETGTKLGCFQTKWRNFFLTNGHLIETELNNVAIKTLEITLYNGIQSPFKSNCADAYFARDSHLLWLVSKNGGIAFYFLKAKFRPGPENFIKPHDSIETFSPIECASYHASLPVAVFAHRNGEIELVRYTSNGLHKTPLLIPGEITSIDLHYDLDYFACLTTKGECFLTSLKGTNKTIKILLSKITSVLFTKENDFLLLCNTSGTISLFSLEKMEVVKAFEGIKSPITKIFHFPKIKRIYGLWGKGKIVAFKIS